MKIGVLALQGDVSEHVLSLKAAMQELGLEGEVVQVRRPAELENAAGLLIPGGESTTIAKQLKRFGLFQSIKDMAIAGKPIMGTCAGCIMVANKIGDYAGDEIEPLALMDITVNRNAYGRQKESFEKTLEIEGLEGAFPGVFIRAPSIVEVGEGVEMLARVNDEAVMVRHKNILALTFHPELTGDNRIHKLFLRMI